MISNTTAWITGILAGTATLFLTIGGLRYLGQRVLHRPRRARPHNPGARLGCWWPERRCAALWGDLVRPDAYGRWHETTLSGIRETEFFLEYDTGTEDLPRLAAKLTGYRMLAARTAITTPVCCSGCTAPAAKPPSTPASPPIPAR